MNVKLLADNGRHTIIRPLVYVEETDIQAFSDNIGFPIVDCSCPVAGVEEQKRYEMKLLIEELAEKIPEIRHSMISAIGNVHPRHLLDRQLIKGDDTI
jgi:tRNA 2-thiocytidine biosynthesis protein TtcA